MDKSLQRSGAEFCGNNKGTLAARCIDTKEVLVLSNCHKAGMNEITKQQKDGSVTNIHCPESISFYCKIMGGVDIADQMAGMYELDRKSSKWWRKVFFRSLMFASVNSWIIYRELRGHPEMPLLDFIIDLSEEMIECGQRLNPNKRSMRNGRRSKRARIMENVGEHLPIEGTTRRRCVGCADKGREKRTKTLCSHCKTPSCKDCFATCHS